MATPCAGGRSLARRVNFIRRRAAHGQALTVGRIVPTARTSRFLAAPKAGSLLKRSRADALTISDPALRAANDGISGEVELRGVHEFADARLGALVAAVNAERVAGFPSGWLFLDSIELALVNSYAVRRPSPPAYRAISVRDSSTTASRCSIERAAQEQNERGAAVLIKEQIAPFAAVDRFQQPAQTFLPRLTPGRHRSEAQVDHVRIERRDRVPGGLEAHTLEIQ